MPRRCRALPKQWWICLLYTSDPNGVLAKYGIPMDKTYFVIWTTTTWTLLGQVDVVIAHQLELSAGNGLAHDLVVLDVAGIHDALDPVSYTHLDVYKRQG